MDIPIDVISALNSCEYLYLREISEPADNRLRILIEEAGATPRLTSREIGGVEFSDLRAIESSDLSRLFEIVWESYIADSVRNGSFTVLDAYEVIESGRIACVYSKSRFSGLRFFRNDSNQRVSWTVPAYRLELFESCRRCNLDGGSRN